MNKKVTKKEKNSSKTTNSGKKSKNSTKKSSSSTQKKNRFSSLLRFKVIRVVCSVLKSRLVWACVFGIIAYIGYCFFTLPDIKEAILKTRSAKVVILASDGTELASYGSQYSFPVILNELPPYIPQALIATEDRRFYSHFGVDFRGLLRASVFNLIQRRKAQGASTLTQQLVKNLFLSSEKTIKRKVQELLLSFWLEYHLTKDEILTIYLNRVYFGAGSYGLNAAARKYYGVNAKQLNLYQTAVLIGLLKAPTHYNPLTQPEKSNQRARIVLANMVKQGFVSAKTALNAAEEKTIAGKHKEKAVYYFTDWILEEIDSFLGGISQDLIVKTTLNPKMQEILDKYAKEALSSPEATTRKVSQIAGVVMNENGAVLAMTGGKDYKKSQFNRATQAYRQLGSAVKPFVYLTAFEQGAKPSDIVQDKPISLNGWRPKNANGKYYGNISLHDALVYSVNTVAISTAIETGVRKVLRTVKKFGLADETCEANAAIALGVCQTRLIDGVAAYASILNEGFALTPFGIEEIHSQKGKVLYQRKEGGRARLVSARSIADIDAILTDVVQYGTGKNANPSVLAKGKTGTTQNYRDAWFIGYTQKLAAGIWVGNDDETPMNKVSGGGFPAKIWSKVIHDISLLLRTSEEGDFQNESGL